MCVPVCEEDFERRHELGQGDGRVALQPLLVLVYVLDEDEEVVVGALVVDLGLRALASSHFISLRGGILEKLCELGQVRGWCRVSCGAG